MGLSACLGENPILICSSRAENVGKGGISIDLAHTGKLNDHAIGIIYQAINIEIELGKYGTTVFYARKRSVD
jgi:hypothetical protein